MGKAAEALRFNGEMTIAEAAEYCGLSTKTIRNYLASKQGPRHVKRFGRLSFTSGDLDAWIKQNTVVKKAMGRT